MANPLAQLTILTEVRSLVIGGNTAGNIGITSVSSPNLSLVRGRVEITNNVLVTTVSLPSLLEVRNGSLLIRDMDNLATLSASNWQK